MTGLLVLTLNIWGLLHVSRRREERVQQLGKHLASCEADLVALQEVWVEGDAVSLAAAAARGGRLVHSHSFKSGLFGPGLMVLSRYPIMEASFHPFEATGNPAEILQGDYYASKGIGHVRVQLSAIEHPVRSSQKDPRMRGTGPQYDAHLLLTHTHANYNLLFRELWLPLVHKAFAGEAAGIRNVQAAVTGADLKGPPRYREQTVPWRVLLPMDNEAGFRISNMIQLGQLAAALAAAPESHVIVAGDLNSNPSTLEMALLRHLAPCLGDAWAELHPAEDGWTCNAPDNTWTKNARPVRIDYVLSTMEALTAEVVSNTTAGGLSLSDHSAVSVKLRAPTARCPAARHRHFAAAAAAKTEIWQAAAQRIAHTVSHLRCQRKNLLCLAFLCLGSGTGLFIFGFWGPRQSTGAWEQPLQSQLFTAQRLQRGKGNWIFGAASHHPASRQRLQAFATSSLGSLVAGVGFVLWLIAYLGLTGQIRALEASQASQLLAASAGGLL